MIVAPGCVLRHARVPFRWYRGSSTQFNSVVPLRAMDSADDLSVVIVQPSLYYLGSSSDPSLCYCTAGENYAPHELYLG